VISIVLAAVAFNYVQTWRTRSRIVRQAAAILSSEMKRSADSIEYSEHANGNLRFKIRAQKLLETRRGKNLLEGIEAEDFDISGASRSRIRSSRAEYDRENKRALFSGDVQIAMGTTGNLRTDSLFYDLNTNFGTTRDSVRVEMPEVRGIATGARYDHTNKTLQLERDVDFIFARKIVQPDGTNRTEEIRVRSRKGYYSEPAEVIRFEGKAQLESVSAMLSGSTIEIGFHPETRSVTTLRSFGNAAYLTKGAAENSTIQGDRMVFGINRVTQSLDRIEIDGHARFSSQSPASERELSGSIIHIQLDPGRGWPRQIQSQAGVQFRLQRGPEETVIKGDQLEAHFIPETDLLDSLRVWSGARLSSRSSTRGSADQLQAEEIRVEFRNLEGRSTIRELRAERSVVWNSTPQPAAAGRAAAPGRSLSASSLRILYSASGEHPDSADAAGEVVLEGTPMAEPPRVQVRRLRADRVQFHFFPGQDRLRDFEGDGHVQVSYYSPADSAKKTPEQEFRTSSEKIAAAFRASDGAAQSISQWGNFRFQDGTRTATSGSSDYDADKQILILREMPKISDATGTTTGERVEYDQRQRVISVRERVRSVLSGENGNQGTPFKSSRDSSSPSIVTAQTMQYWMDESRARYQGMVQMFSENGQLQAGLLEILEAGENVIAQGDIRHLLPRKQAMPANPAGAGANKPSPSAEGKTVAGDSPILISSAQLQYSKQANSIHYSGHVTLESADIRMASETLDMTLDKAGRQVERAGAKGKLEIQQGGRWARGDAAQYYLSPGMIVVTGNPALLYDPARGKSAAARLTFFTADDRILLENR